MRTQILIFFTRSVVALNFVIKIAYKTILFTINGPFSTLLNKEERFMGLRGKRKNKNVEINEFILKVLLLEF
jgi:hypothetical protein